MIKFEDDRLKIKIKNIPENVRKRICSNAENCSECPFDDPKDLYTKCKIAIDYDPKEKTVKLYDWEFPTNREWLASLSNEDLAAFFTYGVEVNDGTHVNIHTISMSFTSSETGVKDWLSQPCKYLMEKK